MSYTDYLWYKYRGDDGLDIYTFWLEQGNGGSLEEFLAAITNEPRGFSQMHWPSFPPLAFRIESMSCRDANKSYRWDDDETRYRINGSDYNEIDVINGGESNGD